MAWELHYLRDVSNQIETLRTEIIIRLHSEGISSAVRVEEDPTCDPSVGFIVTVIPEQKERTEKMLKGMFVAYRVETQGT